MARKYLIMRANSSGVAVPLHAFFTKAECPLMDSFMTCLIVNSGFGAAHDDDEGVTDIPTKAVSKKCTIRIQQNWTQSAVCQAQ